MGREEDVVERQARRALARMVRASGLVGNGKIPKTALVAMMMALGAMDMGWFRGRWSQLSWEDDSASLMLFGQVFCDLRVKRFDVADHAVQEAS